MPACSQQSIRIRIFTPTYSVYIYTHVYVHSRLQAAKTGIMMKWIPRQVAVERVEEYSILLRASVCQHQRKGTHPNSTARLKLALKMCFYYSCNTYIILMAYAYNTYMILTLHSYDTHIILLKKSQ